jgi:hypothetical protein
MARSSADALRKSEPIVNSLDDSDLHEANRIFRLALRSVLADPRLPDDRDFIFSRQRSPHVAAFGAKLDGRLLGSNFVTNWGSVGFVDHLLSILIIMGVASVALC